MNHLCFNNLKSSLKNYSFLSKKRERKKINALEKLENIKQGIGKVVVNSAGKNLTVTIIAKKYAPNRRKVSIPPVN